MGAARQTYEAFARQLTDCGVATRLDATALEMLCRAYAEYLEADEKVREFGPVWTEPGDGVIPKFCYSPFWAVRNRAWQMVYKLLAEFGMTPSSRSSVTAAAPAAEENPLAAYLRAG